MAAFVLLNLQSHVSTWNTNQLFLLHRPSNPFDPVFEKPLKNGKNLPEATDSYSVEPEG